ncbi:MAG: S8 family serine peptidase [Hyphomicrobiaceae bacterium]
MSDADVSTAEAMGFSVATPVAQPKSLETPVVELMVPKGMSEDEARKSLAAAFPGRAFGLNNLYSGYHTATSASSASKGTSGGGDARCSGDQCYGRVMIGWQQSLETCSSGLAIGMIDTGIDLESQAFAGSAIVARRFSPSGTQEEAYGHATGVAALIVGNGQLGTPGLLPKARLVAADVFYLDENKHVVTDTASLLKALDWLDQAGVKIVNMSFSGPQDDLVAKALANMSAKGVVFVAAAGNNGPAAAPAFPAAYDEVIAVTAVDNRMRGYIQANQGDYIDVAAPGVKIWTAAPKNRSIYQSGTSFAVPFVTAALAAELDSGATGAARDWLVTSGIDDIGAPGADAIFGRGLLRAPKSCGAPEGDLFSSLSSSAPGDETASTSVAQR